jgi:plastocyanin
MATAAGRNSSPVASCKDERRQQKEEQLPRNPSAVAGLRLEHRKRWAFLALAASTWLLVLACVLFGPLGGARAATRSKQRLQVSATPTSPQIGQVVLLRLVNPPAGSAEYQWQLRPGAGYTKSSGATPELRTRFLSAGRHVVGLRLTGAGRTRTAHVILFVRSAQARRAASGRLRTSAHSNRRPGRRASSPRATVARDIGVVIADFNFTPATITIHAGDTLTWTNNGPTAHTATAQDGSFDTGILTKGQTASHTFSSPGTFAYYCKLHPFMKGTVVVLAAGHANQSSGGGSNGGSSGGGTSTGTTSGSSQGSSGQSTSTGSSGGSGGPTLPFTGVNVLLLVLLGFGLAGAGVVLRRVARDSGGHPAEAAGQESMD